MCSPDMTLPPPFPLHQLRVRTPITLAVMGRHGYHQASARGVASAVVAGSPPVVAFVVHARTVAAPTRFASCDSVPF
ncbi:hypothetical protein PR048_027512 [Dryococelus australis]|uniref:UspA domain-containing protein n=1 Tax=Dryococelus australis TaxID=614101 RepID=A0ABQ9GGS2_9NEOP|nr:hypothetical protein PR048_027512 [Dryococelus australis]